MKSNLVIFSVVMAVSAIGGWYFASSDIAVSEIKAAAIADAAQKSQDAIPAAAVKATGRSVASINKNSKDYSNYFKTLMAEKSAQQVYGRSKEIFKDLPQGEALAKWITLGLRLDSSEEFGNEFRSSMAALNQNPAEVLDAITTHYKSLGNEDSFIQSMLINVVHQLEVSKEEKIGFYSERLSDKFILDAKGEPTAASLNLTNSMAFLKQYVNDSESVKGKIEASLSEHRENKKTQKELAVRFAAYFPELQGDINRWSDQ